MSEAPAAAMAAAASPANGTPGKGDQAKKKSDKVSMVNIQEFQWHCFDNRTRSLFGGCETTDE